jgi:hypothetical protein
LIEKDTFDVFVSKQGRVWLVDFNPWEEITESLLFDWEELHELENEKKEDRTEEEEGEKDRKEVGEEGKEGKEDYEDEKVYPIFRIVESQGAIRPTLAMTNRLPSDLVDLSNSSAIEDLCRNFGQYNIPSS